MNTQAISIHRALISVSDKTDIVEFARSLHEQGIEIVSTGGTAALLEHHGIPVVPVERITGMPEMMGGRVKTLSPYVLGGILGLRDRDAKEAERHAIGWIDLVVCNLYPFAQTIQQENCTLDEAVENIDIGGPTMIRAAAKNFGWVAIVTDVQDYGTVAKELQETKTVSYQTRQRLAAKAFAHTSAYDALVQDHLVPQGEFPKQLTLAFALHVDPRSGLASDDVTLRYGENPHQKAAAYRAVRSPAKADSFSLLECKVLQGKRLSFNNLGDTQKAIDIVREFSQPACVFIKHAIPCGVAVANDVADAVGQALEADRLSAYGGIAALNGACTETAAAILSKVFLEVVAAPSFSPEALALLGGKKNLRVIETGLLVPVTSGSLSGRFIGDDLLLQERDTYIIDPTKLVTVTKRPPSAEELKALVFAWSVVRHVRSNAIVIANSATTLGIGSGQVSRVDAVRIAVTKAQGKGPAVLASDAFFPFRDNIDLLKDSEVRAIIQPGGSVRDAEVIAACDELDIAMVFSSVRCFSHA
jgi:phosphoribosylaminoimidazolecarboxamide formyltransferase/IMP cyclohydrolase